MLPSKTERHRGQYGENVQNRVLPVKIKYLSYSALLFFLIFEKLVYNWHCLKFQWHLQKLLLLPTVNAALQFCTVLLYLDGIVQYFDELNINTNVYRRLWVSVTYFWFLFSVSIFRVKTKTSLCNPRFVIDIWRTLANKRNKKGTVCFSYYLW